MKSLTVLFFATAILLVSCCSTATTMSSAKENSNPASLYETKWALKKIYTEAGMQEVNTKAFIRFDKEKNSTGGNGSCNSFGSATTVSGNVISFKNVFSTKMYCEEVQKIEDAFFKQLEKTTRFEITGKKLHLFYGDKLALEFQAE